MNTLLDYFGSAFLINLAERKDRLSAAKLELARVGWALNRSGVQLYVAKKFVDRGTFPGSAGVRGCFHSHLECIRQAYNSGKKSVLLMEDDIALAASIPRLTNSIVSQLEAKPWDFVYFGHEQTGAIDRANSETTYINLLPINGEILTAHLFAVNARIFSRLLDHLDRVAAGPEGDQESGPMPVDGAYNVFRRRNPDIQTLIANPKLGWQRPSRSDLSPRSFDRIRSLRPLVSAFRDMKYAVSRWRR